MSDICSICLSEINSNSIITLCNHLFHTNCLLQWTSINQTCPCCRKNLISRYRLIVQVSENIYSSVLLSENKIKLNISKFVYDPNTGTCPLLPNNKYPELEVHSVISFNLPVYRDTGSIGWKIIKTLMSDDNNDNSKQYLHIKPEPDNKTTYIIVTETLYNPGVFLIKDIFQDIWSHIVKIKKN